jgi:hypothetical protein
MHGCMKHIMGLHFWTYELDDSMLQLTERLKNTTAHEKARL